MATATTLVGVAQVFPVSTSVGAYPAKNRGVEGSPPTSSPVDTAAVASDGSLSFDGLTGGGEYVAAAQVGGVWRKVQFWGAFSPDEPEGVLDGRFVATDLELINAIEAERERMRTAVVLSEFPLIAPESSDTPRIERALAAAGDYGVVDLAGETLLLGEQLDVPALRTLQGPGKLVVAGDSDGGPPFYPVYVAPLATDIRFRLVEFDGNAGDIAGDPDSGSIAPACMVQVGGTNALAPCQRIFFEDCYVHDCKTMGLSLQNLQVGGVSGLVEDNGRDGVTCYFNCRDVDIDVSVARCNDDYVGINSGNGAVVGLCERIRVKLTARGPGVRNKGRGVTVRGGRDITLDVDIADTSMSGVVLTGWPGADLTDVKLSGVIRHVGVAGDDKEGVWIDAVNSSVIRGVRLDVIVNGAQNKGVRLTNSKTSPADDDISDVTIWGTVLDCVSDGISMNHAGINDITVLAEVSGNGGWGFSSAPATANKRIHVNGSYYGNANGVQMQKTAGGSMLAKIFGNTGTGLAVDALTGAFDLSPSLVSGNGTDYSPGSGHTATFSRAYRTLVKSTTWGADPPNLVTGSSTSRTFNVPGAALGDPAVASFANAFLAGSVVSAQVTAADTVAVTIANLSGSDKDFADGALRIEVRKYL